MAQIPDCTFCSIATKLKDNIVYDGGDFWVLYDGFPIAHPHLLIIPKEHVLTYGRLPVTAFSHVHDLMAKAEHVIGRPTLFFEHGDIGQTVKHAHLHAIPFEGTAEDAIQKLELGGSTKTISDFPDLQQYRQYLLFIKDSMVIFLPNDVASLPPAPITNSLAGAFGKPFPAAKRSSPERNNVVETAQKFKKL